MSELPEFDYALFKPDENYSIAFVGSRNSGKTTEFADMYEKWIKDTFDLVVIMCDNPQAQGYSFLKEKDRVFLYPKFVPEIIHDLDQFQHGTNNLLKICLILDDCSSKKGIKYDDWLTQLFIRGRNINTTVIVSTQSAGFINTDNRANMDYLFLFEIRTNRMRSLVAEEFLWDIIPINVPTDGKYKFTQEDKRQALTAWMGMHTEDHNIVVLDFRNNDEIYHYRVAKTSKSKKRPKNEEKDEEKKKNKRKKE